MNERRIGTRMTSTAWRQGAINALLCGVGVLLAWLVVAFVFSWALGRGFGASSKLSFLAVWALAFLAFMVSWIYGRCTRGGILLDCGPHPKRWLFVLNLVLFLFIGLGAASDSTSLFHIDTTKAPDGFSIAGLAL